MKNTAQIILVIFALPLVSIAQQSAGTLKGTVTNNGQPITGANVALQEIQKGAATDNSGRFEIRNIRPGTYRLVVSTVGFAEYNREITVGQSETVALDIELENKLKELDEVVVTGTMRETYVKESPVKVAVVTPKRLQQGQTSSNIMDLVGNINGLSTQLNCGVCGTNAIRINGVEGPNTAVLNRWHAHHGSSGIGIRIKRNQPIHHRPSRSYKGSPINAIRNTGTGRSREYHHQNPENNPSFTADIYAKSTEEANINLAASPKGDRFKNFISGNLLRMENYFDNNGDDFNDVAKRTRISLFGKGTLLGTNGEQRLDIATKIYDENRTGGVRAFTDDLRGSNQIYGESIFTRRAEVMTEYRPAGFDQRLRVSGAFTYHDQDSYYGTEHYDAAQNIIYGQATWDQPLSESPKNLRA